MSFMIGCIIQARTGSNRLPKKILKKLDDKTILDYVIQQTKKRRRRKNNKKGQQTKRNRR